jgi:sugar phosphate isomerase/epimerase
MTINRRRVLTIVSGSLLSMSTNFVFAGSKKNQLNSIGFIGGIVSNELKKDWRGTLEKTAELGYSEIEIGRYLGNSPEEFLSHCKQVGIKPIAGGSSLSPMLKDPQKYIDSGLQIGNKYLVCYWPWLHSANDLTKDKCKEAAESLNRLGERAEANGMTFCFHNHDKEFQKIGDKTAFDYLMEYTDPKTVSVELDLYWVKKGNGDILHCLNTYPGRTKIFHVKDMDNTPERSFACVGEGIIDFPTIFRVGIDQGIQHYIVEKDGETNGISCLKRSADYLKTIKF